MPQNVPISQSDFLDTPKRVRNNTLGEDPVPFAGVDSTNCQHAGIPWRYLGITLRRPFGTILSGVRGFFWSRWLC